MNTYITLVPNVLELRHKAFKLADRHFKLAVRLVEKHGFRTNVVGAIVKRDVAPFAEHLRLALDKEQVEGEERQVLDKLADYLMRDGARGGGLAINRGW